MPSRFEEDKEEDDYHFVLEPTAQTSSPRDNVPNTPIDISKAQKDIEQQNELLYSGCFDDNDKDIDTDVMSIPVTEQLPSAKRNSFTEDETKGN